MRRPIFSEGNYRLESRVREIRQHGSEGGAKLTFVPTPIGHARGNVFQTGNAGRAQTLPVTYPKGLNRGLLL